MVEEGCIWRRVAGGARDARVAMVTGSFSPRGQECREFLASAFIKSLHPTLTSRKTLSVSFQPVFSLPQ